MKRKFYPVLLAIAFFLNGCFLYDELPVEYDYSYNGKFKKYRSYDFFALDQETPDEDNFVIENTIVSHMKLLGYKFKDRKPDLLIAYRVFGDSLQLRGYNQPDIEEWVKRNDTNLEYQAKKLELSEGTLYLQIYDRKREIAIWQGYATEEYGKIDFTNQRHLRNAVRSILDKYKFFADGYLEGQKDILN